MRGASCLPPRALHLPLLCTPTLVQPDPPDLGPHAIGQPGISNTPTRASLPQLPDHSNGNDKSALLQPCCLSLSWAPPTVGPGPALQLATWLPLPSLSAQGNISLPPKPRVSYVPSEVPGWWYFKVCRSQLTPAAPCWLGQALVLLLLPLHEPLDKSP